MLINCTPHPITMFWDDGNKMTFLPSGFVARATETKVCVGEWDGFPVYAIEFGGLVGLPAPSKGVRYIVSNIAAQAAVDRNDLVMVADTVRDGEGRIIGARGLAVPR